MSLETDFPYNMYSLFVLYLFAFLLGTVIGSFLNVCIYRIPAKKSVVFPPSSCPVCGAKIRFYDNIPIISYIILSGKCRSCGHHISYQYPIVELITGILSLFLFVKFGMDYQYLLYLLFVSSLIAISFIDINLKIIPDTISLPGIVSGFFASFVLKDITCYDSLIGILVGGGILYSVAVIYERLRGKMGMGGGDIKLMSMICAWMGWRSIFPVIMISSLSGAIVGSIFILLSGKGSEFKIPFGPFLSLGAIIYLFVGQDLLNWYFNFFS